MRGFLCHHDADVTLWNIIILMLTSDYSIICIIVIFINDDSLLIVLCGFYRISCLFYFSFVHTVWLAELP